MIMISVMMLQLSYAQPCMNDLGDITDYMLIGNTNSTVCISSII